MLVKKGKNTYVESERVGSLYKIIFTYKVIVSGHLICENNIYSWYTRYGH